ncbi:uncharacterized protein N7511_003308 [Penicillium nucicola]|uniref:uncharacterized protein n=1 Tax=Penicillium nucicola TaxID=1850975 RepID=UPI002545ABA0|nr:uncharacterized protein N7511_003308 [Penicillium nucicola]KAJ5771257.1 hypothetical protein N7511_003308 [Penicillium nucicola]
MSFPPTPAMSGEFIIKDQPETGTDVFALPPAALSPNESRRSSRSDPSYVPVSPTSPDLSGRRGSQAARSGSSMKRPLEDFDLPPPPTRTRKIIQMKPKSPAASASKSASKSKDSKGATQTPNEATNTTTSKKKQPSATSAAGRKIARKTAHSLIERRRRSKMNEEFGTLKDMIPACTGQEMHKLAILQASIDYVNYLEKCIRDLKTAGPSHTPAAPPSPTSPEFIMENAPEPEKMRDSSSTYSYSTSASPVCFDPAMNRSMQSQMSDTSPSFSPRTQIPSAQNIPEHAVSVLPSPALGPVWASEEKMHELQGVDQEASAALLMLTRDRRGTADSINEHFSAGTALIPPPENRAVVPLEAQRRKGMSVRDLLIS